MSEMEKNEQAVPAKEEKAKKPAKKSKPGVFARLAKWLRELKSELKKVQWPTAKQTVNNTVIVIVCVIIVGIFIWLFDALSNGVISAIISLVKG